MLHPALAKLLRLRARALVRRLGRGLKTPRGIIFAIVGGVIVASWLMSAVVGATFGKPSDPANVAIYMPLAMLGFFLMILLGGSGRQSLLFSPAEVDFLFAGPFSRRQLLTYKIVGGTFGIALTSIFFLIFTFRHATHLFGALAGSFLALQFMQLLSMFISLVGQSASARLATRGRRLALLVIAVGLIIAVAQAAPHFSVETLGEFIRAARETTAARILLAPFAVYTSIFTAPALWPDAMFWIAVGLAINLALVALIFWIDRDFMEAAAASSRAHYDRVMKAARTGGLRTWDAKRAAKMRVPLLPRMAGVGPVLRRQLLQALRTSRSLVITLVILLVVAATVLRKTAADEAVTGLLIGACTYVTFFLTMMLRFDFRTEIEHMDLLKSLPLRAEAIVVGELLTPVLITTAFQTAIIAIAFYMLGGLSLWLAVIPPFALVVNFIWLAVENAFFLIYPTRRAFAGPADLQMMGRGVVTMLAKLLVIAIVCGASAGLGWAAYLLSGQSWLAFIVTSWLVLVVAMLALIPAVALTFRRFDVSRDMPG